MQRIEHQFVAMGGPCRLRLDVAHPQQAKIAIAAAENELARLENKYSRYREDSLVCAINRAAGSGISTVIDTETASLLHYSDTLWRESDGLFDLTSGVLGRAWDFKSRRLPKQHEIDSLLELVGWSEVNWDDQQISLPRQGMELDFGGCVKEYACDALAQVLQQHEISHGLVDLAGDMFALGSQASGEPWQVGIQHPEREVAIATVPLFSGALASSGDYRRCIRAGGQRYGHILNPRTGWPVQGLVAVSVLAEQCLVAGSATTLALLKPEQEGLDWLQALGLPWLAIDEQLVCHGTVSEGCP